jgi:hypothetical protein
MFRPRQGDSPGAPASSRHVPPWPGDSPGAPASSRHPQPSPDLHLGTPIARSAYPSLSERISWICSCSSFSPLPMGSSLRSPRFPRQRRHHALRQLPLPRRNPARCLLVHFDGLLSLLENSPQGIESPFPVLTTGALYPACHNLDSSTPSADAYQTGRHNRKLLTFGSRDC